MSKLLLTATLAAAAFSSPASAQTPFFGQLLCDVLAGFEDSNPSDFTRAGSTVYFVANNGTGGRVVYRVTGPTQCEAIDLGLGDAGYSPSGLTVVNGDLYFSTVTAAEGAEIGAVVGGIPFYLPINGGTDSGLQSMLVAFQGSAYFGGDDGSNTGTELWKVTVTTPSLVSDIGPMAFGGSPRNFVAVGDRLYFEATTPETGTDVFAWTGSALISFDTFEGSSDSQFAQVTIEGDTLFFVNFDRDMYGIPATATTATFVASFNEVRGLQAAAALVFIAADDGVNGTELYSTDGGTPVRHDLRPGPESAQIGMLTAAADKIWMNGDNGTDGKELHRFDPNTSSFESFDLNPGSAGSEPVEITPYDADTVAVGASIAGFGDELVTAMSGDGPDGSVLDIRPGPPGSFPDMLTVVNDELIFLRANTTTGDQLLAQTFVSGQLGSSVVQIPGLSGSPNNLTVVDGNLYFSAPTSTEGREPRFVQVPEPGCAALACAAIAILAPALAIRRAVPGRFRSLSAARCLGHEEG